MQSQLELTENGIPNSRVLYHQAALRHAALQWQALVTAGAREHADAVKKLAKEMYGERNFIQAMMDVRPEL